MITSGSLTLGGTINGRAAAEGGTMNGGMAAEGGTTNRATAIAVATEAGSHRPEAGPAAGTRKYKPSGYRALPAGVTPKPCTPDHARRSFSHDYRARGFYLITVTMIPRPRCAPAPGEPVFLPLSSMPHADDSQLKKGEMIMPILTDLGLHIKEEIDAIPAHHPKLRISRYVIMPDHIHLLIEVRERLDKHLGKELAGFLGACSRCFSALQNLPSVHTLFKPYHDRIIRDAGQLNRAFRYIEDNPRRMIIKNRNPDLFRKFLNLRIKGRIYSAYGNIFLLRSIWLLPVRIHRKWSQQESENYFRQCEESFKAGAVPISPAIHRSEKEIVNMALKLGRPVVKIVDKGFAERFKPQGGYFELCAEGKLLMLSAWPENTSGKSTSGYKEFHEMNDIALGISALTPEDRISIIDTNV
ncbi:MAG: hypothetical protein K2O24_07560 [Muribaculaceae bacterium]|nr:hypothetical protein [Muribaculaceae bacterium]